MAINRLVQPLLLTIALLPCAIVVVLVLHVWLNGETDTLNWQSAIWPVVVLQLLALAAFWAHAASNARLAPGELGGWIFQFVVYIPFGMLSYWAKHVWGQPSQVRP